MGHCGHGLRAAVHHHRFFLGRATEVERPPSLANGSEDGSRWCRSWWDHIDTVPPVVCADHWRDTGRALVVFRERDCSMKAAQDVVVKVEHLSNGSLSGSSGKTGRGRLVVEDSKVGLPIDEHG